MGMAEKSGTECHIEVAQPSQTELSIMALGVASTPVSMPVTATAATPLKAPNEPGSTAQLKGPVAAESSSAAADGDEPGDVRPSHTVPILMAPRHVTIELATTPEELAALKPEYDRLHAACGNTLPFALHEWHLSWWEHLARTEGKVRDRLRIYVVRDELGHCVAIVPFVSTRRELRLPLDRVAPSPGRGPEHHRAPVAPGHPGHRGPRGRSRDAPARGRRRVGLGAVVRRPGPLRRGPGGRDADHAAPARPRLRRSISPRRGTPSARGSSATSASRSGIVTTRSSATGWPWSSRLRETPDAVRNALHIFLSLHAMRAGLAKTVTHPDRFATDAARRFLYDVCDRLAARGVARIFVLKIRGCAVAARVAFVVGDQMYLYYSGFDPALGEVQRVDHDRRGGHQVRHRQRADGREPVDGRRRVEDALGRAARSLRGDVPDPRRGAAPG